MEILAHTLWTTAAARKANAVVKKKGKLYKLSVAWTAFWGIFPDLFAFSLPFFYSFWKVVSGQQDFGSFSTRHQVADGFNLAHTLYQYSHSLVIWALVFLIVWALLRRPPWVLFGWALHILIDIPTHSLAFFPTPFLFPISKFVFPYGVAWSTTWFMIANYCTLALLWGSILYNKYRRKKNFGKIEI
jgi:hypothetical protein